jgi:23S rRNA (uracil1939-C5)-methyltransferase
VGVELRIEKWIYGGEGLARMAPDEAGRGKAVFVPFVLPGETVEAEFTEERSGFARAKLVKIGTASPARVEPSCPYFSRCGGCQYQHAEYTKQLQWKRDILVETLARTAKIELAPDIQLHHAEPYGYRNRTRLKVRTEPNFALGYYRFGSNELFPVEECPISSPLIQRAIAAMWSVASKRPLPPGLREIQFFANHADEELLVEIFVDRKENPKELEPLANRLRAELPAIVGVSVFPSGQSVEDEDRAPLMTSKAAGPAATFGEKSLRYASAGDTFRVSAGSFFQTNRFLVDELVQTAISGSKGRTALDLYAGTGLFSLPLSRSFERVVAVEASPYSFADLHYNATPNIKAVQSSTEKFLDNLGRKPTVDLVLLDPPRSGMGEHTSRKLGQTGIPRLTYVSCDPATLARDLRVLSAAGFAIESLHLVDLFPQTFHMETAVHLVR